jgi:hypothetical protein
MNKLPTDRTRFLDVQQIDSPSATDLRSPQARNYIGSARGLARFARVIDADYAHSYSVVGLRQIPETPLFNWVNANLGHTKNLLNGAHKDLKVGVYASQPALVPSPSAPTAAWICRRPYAI